MAAVYHRSHRLHPARAAYQLPLVHSTKAWLFRLPGQPSCYPVAISVRRTAPDYHMGIGEVPGAINHLQSFQHLDLPMAYRAHHTFRQSKSVDPVCASIRPALVSILPCYSRRVERKELKFRAHTRSVSGILQHVRAVREHHCSEHLSR